MTAAEPLLLCSHCNGDVNIQEMIHSHLDCSGHPYHISFRCVKCGAETNFYGCTKPRAIQLFNTRTLIAHASQPQEGEKQIPTYRKEAVCPECNFRFFPPSIDDKLPLNKKDLFHYLRHQMGLRHVTLNICQGIVDNFCRPTTPSPAQAEKLCSKCGNNDDWCKCEPAQAEGNKNLKELAEFISEGKTKQYPDHAIIDGVYIGPPQSVKGLSLDEIIAFLETYDHFSSVHFHSMDQIIAALKESFK